MAWNIVDVDTQDPSVGGWSVAPAAPVDAASVEYGRVLDVVSEGPIVGLVDGLKSVYLEETPIQNPDGSFNFKAINVLATAGTNSQAALAAFPAVESEVSVVTKVIASTPVVRTINTLGATSARVKISIPALQTVSSTTGMVTGGSVAIKIEVQNNGGGYVNQPLANLGQIRGKFSSKFVRGYRVALPSPGPWDIRVTRLTPDSGSAYVQNDTYFESLTTITDSKLRYPNTALIGLTMDAKQFRSIPRRAYEIKGRIISVPANYDPVARSYATTGTGTSGGVWDGTFKQAWTDNPAWIWYDMATNTRYGGGSYLDASKVDKWTLYAIAQVCDAYVPAGRSKRTTLSVTGTFAADATNSKLTRGAGSWVTDGFIAGDEVILSGFTNAGNNHRARVVSVTATDLVISEITLTTEAAASRTVALQDFTEPRFTCNVYFQARGEAIRFLSDLASAFRGMTYWASGAVFPVQDVDASPAAIFNCSNVEKGEFTYSGTPRKARHTVAVVTWNDPANAYRQQMEYVEDANGIARYGLNPVQLTAFGCTSQGQARRLGAWVLLSELNETETVQFVTALEGITVRPGEVIQVQDQFRAASRMGGRVAAGSTTTVIQLDSQVTIKAGTSYQLTCTLPNGTIETKAVSTSASVGTSLTVSAAFSSAPGAGAPWVLSVVGQTQLYRVIGVSELEGNRYQVTALIHSPSKYAAVDSGTVITTSTGVSTPPLVAPSGLSTTSSVRVLKDRLLSELRVYWTAPTDALSYIAQASHENGPWENMTVSGLSAWINATPGDYRIRVYAVFQLGTSLPTETTVNVPEPTTTTRATDITSARTRNVVFTSGSGSLVIPDDVDLVEITLLGAGGGGAGGGTASTKGGSGGGSGGYLKKWITVTPGASLSYSVGAAGTAGAAGGTPTNGGDGGDTTFNGITVKGGKGGVTNGGTSGAGGDTLNPLDLTTAVLGAAGALTAGADGVDGTLTSTTDNGVSVSGASGGVGNVKTTGLTGGRGGKTVDYIGKKGGNSSTGGDGGGGGGAASPLGGEAASGATIGQPYGQGGKGGQSNTAGSTAGTAGGSGFIRVRW